MIAASNQDLVDSIKQGTFREDLYYRLNVFPLSLSPLRERHGDIKGLTAYFVDSYNRELGKRVRGFSDASIQKLEAHTWPGNVRELQNIIERILITCKNELVEPKDFPFTLENGSTPTKDLPPLLSLGLSMEDLEKRIIQEALEKTDGNVSDASKLLGLTRGTLRYRIQKYKI